MAFFDWFGRFFARSAPAAAPEPMPVPAPEPADTPESHWRIGCDGDTLWMESPEGVKKSVAISGLAAVAIEASDRASDQVDLWWLFYGPEEDVAFVVPLGARGEAEVVERIAALPGFRHDLYAEAVRSTDIDTFVIWTRPLD